MQNIKKIIYYSMIGLTLNFCSIYPSVTGVAEAGRSAEKVAKIVTPAAERITQLLAKSGIDGLNIVSKTSVDLANIAAPTVEKVSQIAGDSLVDASSKVGVESIEKLAKVGDKAVVVVGTIAGVAVAVHSFTKLYPIGKEIAGYACPSEEQIALEKANTERAQKELEILKAEREFRECLLNNKKHPDRSVSGLPMVCLSAAEAFAQFGKEVEVKRATECFNSFREEECSKR